MFWKKKNAFPLKLRSKPEYFRSREQIDKMINRFGFFCSQGNSLNKGIVHSYQIIELNGINLIMDHTTGLLWQSSHGDLSKGKLEGLQKHFSDFGFIDPRWTLPTMEEAMSLVERQKSGMLHINPIFDKDIWNMFTCDAFKDSGRRIVIDLVEATYNPEMEEWIEDARFRHVARIKD